MNKILVAILFAACTADPAIVDTDGVGGKADDGSDSSRTKITCEGLSLRSVGGGEYVARVSDAAAVEYFVTESQKTDDSSGITVEKTFPWMVQADGDDLVVSDFRLYDGGTLFLTSGPPGTELRHHGDDSVVLEIRGGHMPSSHQVVYYTVGQWTFSGCTGIPDPEPVVLDFDADWNENASAAIHYGDSVVLHYDLNRLVACVGTYYGQPAWNIQARYQIDGGDVQTVMVTEVIGQTQTSSDPEIQIPDGSELTIWFHSSAPTCEEWDSNYGDNYHFAIL